MSEVQYVDQTFVTMKINDLLYDNTIYLDCEVDRNSQVRFCRELRKLAKQELEKPIEKRLPIKIRISSFGGWACSLMAMVSEMEYWDEKGVIIETYCDGYTASAGSKILMAGTKGHRYITRYATCLIHQPNGGCYGTYAEMKQQIDELSKDFETIKEMFRKHTKLTEEDLENLTKYNLDVTYRPQECIEKGIVDIIL